MLREQCYNRADNRAETPKSEANAMANINDYLKWRGDLLLSERPLNEIDGLILTRFAYLPFEEIRFGTDETVASLCEKVQKLPPEKFRLEEDVTFILLLAKAPRFKDMKVTDFVKTNDEDAVLQFAAVTIHLTDDILYISYCGTDSTLLGWKEDFYMSFMEDIPAQVEALKYAQKLFAEYPEAKFHIGGHSKGGNLAVYTAVNLTAEEKERLLHVSNYDGPGFPQSFIKTHDFATVNERMDTFIPQDSMIGRIHEHEEGFRVVESTEKGIRQHNFFSWLFGKQKMKLLPQPDESSDIMYRAIQNVLSNTTPEQRKLYVDNTYDLLITNEKTTMKDIFDDFPKHMNSLFRNATGLSAAERQSAQDMNAAMVKSYVDAVRSAFKEESKNTVEVFLGKLPFQISL